MRHLIKIGVFCLMGITSCITPLDFKDIGYDDLLVVDALITDQEVIQKVYLTRSVQLTDTSSKKETNAVVWVENEIGDKVMFEERRPGAYFSAAPFAAQLGHTYTLRIETNDGRSYTSSEASMNYTPTIDSIYAEFEPSPYPHDPAGGKFHFFVDSHQNTNRHKYFRWTWNSTFKLSVPTPARWKWLGGNDFILIEYGSPNGDQQIQYCWKSDSSTQILLEELLNESAEIRKKEILSFHSETRMMFQGYSIEIKQYAISKQSFDYWSQIEEINQKQGSLSDKQVGTIRGNMSNSGDSEEIVLGYFDVAQEQKLRKKFVARDFLKEGYRVVDVSFVYCSDTEPAESSVDEIGSFLEANPGWILGYFITSPPTAVYLRRRCADCTLYGSNVEPPFWN